MFEHHRKSPWFAEKYDPAPEFQALRTRVRKVGWRGRMDAFVMDLESGKFDPDLTEAATDGGKEHLNGESSAANGVKTEAESAEEKPTGGDDDMQFNVEGEEDAGGLRKGSTSKDDEDEYVSVLSVVAYKLTYKQRGRRRGRKGKTSCASEQLHTTDQCT